MRETGTILDGELLEATGEHVELTEPTLRPPSETVGRQRYRVRMNESSSVLSGTRNGTWCEIEDRPADQLLGVVDDACLVFDPGPSRREAAERTASRLKHHPDGPCDVRTMEAVVEVLKGERTHEEAVGDALAAHD